MYNSIGKNHSDMVNEEGIMMDVYDHSQNFGRSLLKTNTSDFSTFKPTLSKNNGLHPDKLITTASSEKVRQSREDGGEVGIVHLSTRIISDDVPPRDYQGLKSESVISLTNVTTLPNKNKRTAPVADADNPSLDKRNTNDGVDDENLLYPSNGLINNGMPQTPSSSFMDLPSSSKKPPAPPPPLSLPTVKPPRDVGHNQKVKITAFERGKLPSIANNPSKPKFSPTETPISVVSGTADSNPGASATVPSHPVQRSNFQLGLPTVLSDNYRREIESVVSSGTGKQSKTKNPNRLDVILQAPKEFSDATNSTQISPHLLVNGLPLSPDGRKVSHSHESPQTSREQSHTRATSNSLIRPFKLKSTEDSPSVKPVEFNVSDPWNETSQKENKRKTNIDAVIRNAYSVPPKEFSEVHDISLHAQDKIYEYLENKDLAKSFQLSTALDTIAEDNRETVINDDIKLETSASQSNNRVLNIPVSTSDFKKTPQVSSTGNNKIILKHSEVSGKGTSLTRPSPRQAIEIPTNEYINNVNFRNHLEGIIAKSATSTLKVKHPRSPANRIDQPNNGQVRKYRFLVEGIDVPKGTFSGNQSDSDAKERDSSSAANKKELIGFSYIIDKELAKQVTQKAVEVTARRPHEFVESFTLKREEISQSKSIDDNDVLRQARANLHAHLKGLQTNQEDVVEMDASGKVFHEDSGDGNPKNPEPSTGNVNSQWHCLSNLADEALGDDWKKFQSDSHSIPHDTSRIFLRPHDKDGEHLKRLEEERDRSLTRKNHLTKLMDSEEHLKSFIANQNLPNKFSSNSNAEVGVFSNSKMSPMEDQSENTGRYRKSRNGSESSVISTKKARIKNLVHNGTSVYLSNDSLTPPDPRREAPNIIDRRLVHRNAGNHSPVVPAADKAVRRAPYSSSILPHMSDDESKARTLNGESNSRRYKQKKIKQRKKNYARNFLLQSSENSDEDYYVYYRSSRRNLRARNKEETLSKTFDSEPEILDSARNVVPRNVLIEIENHRFVKAKSTEIVQRNPRVAGKISLNESPPSNEVRYISGELIIPREQKQSKESKSRSKTLPNTGISIVGPGIYHKISDNKVDGVSPHSQRARYVKRTNNDLTQDNSLKRSMYWSHMSMPSLEPTSVDPELDRISKQGGQYRVQMKLNAVSGPAVGGGLLIEPIRESNYQAYSNFVKHDEMNSSSKYIDKLQIPRSATNYLGSQSSLHANRGGAALSFQVTPNENVLKSQINEVNNDSRDGYIIKSIKASAPPKNQQPSTIEFDLELLNAGQPSYSVLSSRDHTRQNDQYNSPINNAMRLEFEPRRIKEPLLSRKRNQRIENRVVPDSMLLMRDQIQSQDLDGIPRIVTGSILIRNSLDKNTSRRYLEALNQGGSGGKQDNNLFHGKYYQRRENPMYASDLEVLEYTRSGKRMLDETRSRELPEVAIDWNNTDGHQRNVPIKKEWYYDHIFNSSTHPNFQTSKKSGAWKLRTSRTDKEVTDGRGNAGSNWLDSRNFSTTSGQHIRQSIDVTREEEELIGPLQGETVQEVKANLNVDAISEKVELRLSDGFVTIEVRVRCERLVPIRGTVDMFRKSAVLVTRKIEIDMTVNPERKAMYDAAVSLSKKQESVDQNDKCLRLSSKDTFELYCKLMEMADEVEGSQEGLSFGSVHIDKELEEEKRLPYGATSPEALITDDDLIPPKNSSVYHNTRARVI